MISSNSSNSNAKDQDYLLALQLQIELAQEEEDYMRDAEEEFKSSSTQIIKKSNSNETEGTTNLVSPEWELLDPNPDVRALFQEFDKKYFYSRLGSCRLEWSKRMTICAGKL